MLVDCSDLTPAFWALFSIAPFLRDLVNISLVSSLLSARTRLRAVPPLSLSVSLLTYLDSLQTTSNFHWKDN